jgi:hypothetical protein
MNNKEFKKGVKMIDMSKIFIKIRLWLCYPVHAAYWFGLMLKHDTARLFLGLAMLPVAAIIMAAGAISAFLAIAAHSLDNFVNYVDPDVSPDLEVALLIYQKGKMRRIRNFILGSRISIPEAETVVTNQKNVSLMLLELREAYCAKHNVKNDEVCHRIVDMGGDLVTIVVYTLDKRSNYI